MNNTLLRIQSILKEKKNVINLGLKLGYLPNNQVLEIPDLVTQEKDISLAITRMIWDYYEKNNSTLSDGEQTRLIFKSCAFAGMLATYIYEEDEYCDEDDLFEILQKGNISELIRNVEAKIGIDFREHMLIIGWLTQSCEETYNNLYYAYNGTPTDGETRWQAWQDTCSIMFCLGMTYASHRIKGNLTWLNR
ncbi:MAG: hypothetical protein IKY64_06425 [Bacteroidaceae bacterium]|nr:hypothetical protein [Bacteroidaceae bacterium]